MTPSRSAALTWLPSVIASASSTNAVSTTSDEIGVLEDYVIAIRHGHLRCFQRNVAAARWLRQAKANLFLSLRHFDAFALHSLHAVVQHFCEPRALLGLASHGIGQGLQSCDIGILAGRHFLFARNHNFFLFDKLAVVPLVVAQSPLPKTENAINGLIEEWQIVADHQQSSRESLQFIEEPALG